MSFRRVKVNVHLKMQDIVNIKIVFKESGCDVVSGDMFTIQGEYLKTKKQQTGPEGKDKL